MVTAVTAIMRLDLRDNHDADWLVGQFTEALALKAPSAAGYRS